MEVSGVVFSKPHHHVLPCSSSKPWVLQVHGRDGKSMLKLKDSQQLRHNLTFRDETHLQYYSSSSSPVALQGKANNNLKNKKPKSTKKAVKLLKSLSEDLPLVSHHDNSISEAARVLMNHLQQLRAEEKELKKQKKKDEKAKLKASKMNSSESSSSSSSSESSGSECGELVDMSRFRNEAVAVAVAQPFPGQLQQLTQTQATSIPQDSNPAAVVNDFPRNGVGEKSCCGGGVPFRATTTSCSNATSLSVMTQATPQKRIEVCMGNKCKKLGGEALLQEFDKVMGVVQGGAVDVVGCKCMGKCRDGPNVRVCNSVGKGLHDSVSVRTPANPLCIGVGLEDVGAIVANFFAEDSMEFGLAPAS